MSDRYRVCSEAGSSEVLDATSYWNALEKYARNYDLDEGDVVHITKLTGEHEEKEFTVHVQKIFNFTQLV